MKTRKTKVTKNQKIAALINSLLVYDQMRRCDIAKLDPAMPFDKHSALMDQIELDIRWFNHAAAELNAMGIPVREYK